MLIGCLCIFFWRNVLFLVHFPVGFCWVLRVILGINHLPRYTVCKYFLPLHGLAFHLTFLKYSCCMVFSFSIVIFDVWSFEFLWWPVFFFAYAFGVEDVPGGSDGKASVYNAVDPGSIPGSGRSPWEGNGNPLQYPCLENSMVGGAWWATVCGIAKSQTRLSDFTFSAN